MPKPKLLTPNELEHIRNVKRQHDLWWFVGDEAAGRCAAEIMRDWLGKLLDHITILEGKEDA